MPFKDSAALVSVARQQARELDPRGVVGAPESATRYRESELRETSSRFTRAGYTLDAEAPPQVRLFDDNGVTSTEDVRDSDKVALKRIYHQIQHTIMKADWHVIVPCAGCDSAARLFESPSIRSESKCASHIAAA